MRNANMNSINFKNNKQQESVTLLSSVSAFNLTKIKQIEKQLKETLVLIEQTKSLIENFNKLEPFAGELLNQTIISIDNVDEKPILKIIKLKDVIIDFSIFTAVVTLNNNHKIPNYHNYWDEDGGFFTKDDRLLPLSRFDILEEENDLVIPPIVMRQDSNKKWLYSDGRHRHLRLLIKNNFNPETELIEGIHFVCHKFSPELKENNTYVRFRQYAKSKHFYLHVYHKNLDEITINDFKRRNLPCFEYHKCVFKYEGGTKSEAKILIQRLFSNFNAETLIDNLKAGKDKFLDFLGGLTTIFDIVAGIGHVRNEASSAYQRFQDTYVNPVTSSNLLCYFKTFGMKIIRLVISVFRLVNAEECGLVNLIPLVLDIYELLTGISSFRNESLDTLLIAGISSILPKNLLDIVKKMSMFSSRKLFDDHGILLDFLSTITNFLQIVINYLPSTIQTYAVDLMKVFGLNEYICLKRAKVVLNKYQENKHIMLENSFRNEVKTIGQALKDMDIKRFFAKNKPLSDIYADFHRLEKGVKSYEETSRQEPCCFVFEGPPGCRKSVTVNKLISVLGLTHYAHIVKCAEDGKDWYDAYNSEDIFYMDDVGQMGKSQWRNLINWVSAVKLPLDCAEASLKDTKYFNSEIILLTTNRFINLNGFTSKDCIDSPSALWRRGYVFDFSDVIGIGPTLSGVAKFKYFNILTNQFEQNFPGDFKEFLNFKNIQLETVCDASNQNDFLLWLSTIVKGIRKMKKEQLSNNSLDNRDIDGIRQLNPFENEIKLIPNLNWCKDMFIEYYNFTLEILKDLAIDMFKLCTTNPSLSLCGLTLSIGLVTLLYKFKNHFFEEGAFLTKICDSTFPLENYETLDLKLTHNLLPKISSQVFEIDMTFEDKGLFRTVSCYCLISGRKILVPYHLVLDRRMQIVIFKNRKLKHVLIDHSPVQLVYKNVENDVAIMCLSDGYPTPFAKLANCFNSVPDEVVGLVFPNKIMKIEGILSEYSGGPIVYPIGEINNVVINPLVYKDLHFPGMCGVVLTTKHGSIVGMHVAGSDSQHLGVSLRWTEKCRNDIYNCFLEQDNGLKLSTKIMPKDYEECSGIRIESDLNVFVPKNSNFVKSPLFNLFENTRKPANLSVYGNHTIKDVAKGSRSLIGPVSTESLEYAAKVIDLYFEDFGDLSEYEIVKGDELLAPINKKSSNGIFPIKSKLECFDYEKGCFKDDFKVLYDKFEDEISRGDISIKDIAWFETLKDELRNNEKLEPRSFRVSPVTMQVLTKKCFGKMVKKIVKERWSNEIMIGINPFSEWPRLYNLLNTGKAWAGDIGKYDKNMRVQVQLMVAEVILKYYKGKNQQAARNILTNIAYNVVVLNDDTWILTHSLPSGCWLTAIFNSLVNRVYTAMWYYEEMKRNGQKVTPTSFHRDLADPVYGDDRGNTCKNPKFEHFLNALTMEKFFNSIGMTMTDSLKGEIKTPFQPVEEMTFLKRYFRFHPKLEGIVCPLDLRTVYSTLSWIDKSKENQELVLQDKINAFQREIFLHYDIYDSEVTKLEDFCVKNNIHFSRLSEKYLINLYSNGIYDDFYCSAYDLLKVS